MQIHTGDIKRRFALLYVAGDLRCCVKGKVWEYDGIECSGNCEL